jgi:hypothetical protein
MIANMKINSKDTIMINWVEKENSFINSSIFFLKLVLLKNRTKTGITIIKCLGVVKDLVSPWLIDVV